MNEDAHTKEVSPDVKKILFVEDDEFLRTLLLERLKKENLKILVATNGNDAVDRAKNELPSLILLDLILAGKDGFQVLKELKKDGATSSIPVIILSNVGQKEDIEKGLALGAEDYLIKAEFTPAEIVEKIQKVLN